MNQFLFVSLREGTTGRAIAESELGDIIRTTGISPAEIAHINIDSTAVSVPDPQNYLGIIVGGSALNVTNETYDEYQRHVHAQLRSLIESATPTLFVCFGLGWLAAETGGSVDQSHPEETGGSTITLEEAAGTDPLCVGLPQVFQGLSGHKESVASVGPEVTVLASGPTCPYQLIRYRDNIWASQFHGEMDAHAMEVRMKFFMNSGYFSPDDYEKIVATLPGIDTSSAHQLVRNFYAYCRRSAA
ncbi:MAG: glutamine amidotransferase [Corynebacterium sp.]|uniref:glutamine amidotransferase-related protein n=1 Tax=Corynebacterium sp. TaxID=1720 RepID=UPI0026DBBF0B|nr:glutamine amidotransferase [Corynebacterium sp.]MDO5097736.1 glutamine amidotransferase [Corynebacterium sp.]